jgi:putative ATPase
MMAAGDDLFLGAGSARDAPLADRMRPRVLDDIAGQDHIVGPGRLLRRAIQADRLSSLIFYGPPGTGKTSLARVIANTTKARFESLNAVLSGIKDIRDAIDRASERRRLYGQRTILFVDEVHRWNKAQQDALLPWVENGAVILVGATTENPFFEVNRALVSRSRVFQLKALEKKDLMLTALRALSDAERGYGKLHVRFEEGALEHLVEVSGGDARSLLNALELAVETTRPASAGVGEGGEIHVSLEAAEESIQRRALLYDKDGDYHFDTISAFIKSVRGSDPDAALYWLAKMLRAGEDPAFIFRRMIILAGEDVGLADPQAIGVVISCAEAFDRIGFPEGNYPLAEACLYLATAPKSNSAMAFFDALAVVEKEDAEVPSHLRDSSRDKEGFGHGEGYVYPHAYREHWRAQQYLPSGLQGKLFYTPSGIGYEKTIRDEVLRKRELQAAALLGEAAALPGDGEFLSWSLRSKGVDAWVRRLETGRSRLLLSCRDAIMEEAAPKRHDRVLVLKADDGLLVWESLRRVPEGLCAACVTSEAARETLLRFAASAALDEPELPKITVCAGVPAPGEAELSFGCAVFDRALVREPWRGLKVSAASIGSFAVSASRLLAPNGRLVFLASPPAMGERLSRIVEAEAASGLLRVEAALISDLKRAEDVFFSAAPAGTEESLLWDAEILKTGFHGAGLELEIKFFNQQEERLITERDISAWFNSEKSSWGGAIHDSLGEKAFETLKNLLIDRAKQGVVLWKWKSLLCRALPAGVNP